MSEAQWPPKDGRSYIHSEDFGKLVVDEAVRLGCIYQNLDLADSVATTFQWLNSKLNENRNFISRKRFPSRSAFRAYIRQMIYNSGVRAYRFREKHLDLTAVPPDDSVIDSPSASLQQKEELLKLVNQLEEPHKTVITRYFFDEDPLHLIATCLDLDENQTQEIYEEAVDEVRRLAKKLNLR